MLCTCTEYVTPGAGAVVVVSALAVNGTAATMEPIIASDKTADKTFFFFENIIVLPPLFNKSNLGNYFVPEYPSGLRKILRNHPYFCF
jgi:hypothetical protein